jgi:hypothetical protein
LLAAEALVVAVLDAMVELPVVVAPAEVAVPDPVDVGVPLAGSVERTASAT